jgi:histidyl-tRNA synthetase
MKIIKGGCYKGTRILVGNNKRDMLNQMISALRTEGFVETSIPVIQPREIFRGKVGEENNNLMFNFTDRGNREICLAPEYTAVIQNTVLDYFKNQKDTRLFYAQECFRGEKPQRGRYRQFTQLGVEILNPTMDYTEYLIDLAHRLISYQGEVNREVTRGLDYYKEGKGFEISLDTLGSSKQVCGGGSYEGGIGFALGIDRLLDNDEN